MDDDSEVPSENEMDGTLRDDRLGLSSSKAAEEEFQESTFDPRLE